MKALKKTHIATVILALAAVTIQGVSAQAGLPQNLNEAVSAACAADKTIVSEKAQLSSGNPVDQNGNKITHEQLRKNYIADVNQKSLSVAKDLIDLDIANIKYQYLLNKKIILASQLKSIQAAFQTGKAQSADVTKIQKEVNQNSFDINSYKMLIANAKKVFTDLTGKQLAPKFDFGSCYYILDVAKIPSPLPSVTQNTQGSSPSQILNDVIKNYRKLGDGIGGYISARETLEGKKNDMKTGKATQAVVNNAANAKDDARIEALESKADYSESLYELDCSLQGYLSKTVKKPKAGLIFTSEKEVP